MSSDRLGGKGHIISYVRSFANYEERSRIGDAPQSSKVHIAAVQHVVASRLDRQIVQPRHIRVLCGSDREEGWKRPPQVECHVKLHRCVVTGPVGPRAERETQLYQGGVHSI